VRALTGSAYLVAVRVLAGRWIFFVLGGALFTPYAIFAMIVVPLAVPSVASVGNVTLWVGALLLVAATIVLTSRVPLVRTIEASAVPSLLAGPATGLVLPAAHSVAARRRQAGWYLLHLFVGAALSLASVVGPPLSLRLLLAPWFGSPSLWPGMPPAQVPPGWAVVLGPLLLAALVAVTAGLGWAAAWLAPRLLGPDQADRLAALERRTAELTERNRLARELHDSIGHALSVTTLQAMAARKVLDRDPQFAAEALAAIEHTGRAAAADLDDFLGLLREEASARAPQPTLADVEALVASHREAGLPVALEVSGDVASVAAVVSREVYRIVQEGLTNVQRHAGAVPTRVWLVAAADQLRVEVSNEAAERARLAVRSGRGGRGLDGIRERVGLLGGRFSAGAENDGWMLRVSVPTGGGPR
jgi:signal transduction histidine kinase